MQLYTIQNENGDKGWIQVFDLQSNTCRDDVMGGSYQMKDEWLGQFIQITKEEYDTIANLHNLLNETGLEEYIDLITNMINVTIERNAEKTLDKVL